jgi:aspartyl-tRNA(Asn)/glutamyl-tRNA(Gln) amidotransferase subunit A
MGSRGRLLTAMTVREAGAALTGGDVSARLLLASAVTRMGPTRQLNAFIGGVLPRAELAADASDARRQHQLANDGEASGDAAAAGGGGGGGGGGFLSAIDG